MSCITHDYAEIMWTCYILQPFTDKVLVRPNLVRLNNASKSSVEQ